MTPQETKELAEWGHGWLKLDDSQYVLDHYQKYVSWPIDKTPFFMFESWFAPILSLRADGTSKYKGVSWKSGVQKWVAQIGDKSKRKHLGYFEIEEEAAKAYDAAAVQKWGEFALINFREAVKGCQNQVKLKNS